MSTVVEWPSHSPTLLRTPNHIITQFIISMHVFQRLMDVVLSECMDVSSVYIDDVLIMSASWKEHVVHLVRVFKCLLEAGLTCKPAKCVFGKAKLVFLGHTIGGGRLSVPKDRVTALMEFPRPMTRKQLRGFLGTVNFYQQFVRDFHHCSSILTPSVSKSVPVVVEWTRQMLEAFVSLKNMLCDSVCLCIPCMSDKFILETDASGAGVGAVLSVRRGEELLPVAFFSKQLQGAEHCYSAQELEGLGLFKTVRHFAFYLYGTHFKVVTDHKPLVTLMSQPQQNKRLLNWAMKLAEFDFEVIYRSRSENMVANCLSRRFTEVTHCQKEGGEDVVAATYREDWRQRRDSYCMYALLLFSVLFL